MSEVERPLQALLPSRREVIDTAEGLLDDPPKVIMVFDNFRGAEDFSRRINLAGKTMETRSAIAALLYHSNLYQTEENLPVICSFAGEHTPNGTPGSAQVARFLDSFNIKPEHIYLRRDTITPSTDMIQFHSLIKSLQSEGPVAIVTTDDHVKRTAQEWINHFADHRTNYQLPKLYVLSPSTPQLQEIEIRQDIALAKKRRGWLLKTIRRGQSRDLNGGFTETGAVFISALPGPVRRILQLPVERFAHKHIPLALARNLKAAKAIQHKHH